MLSQVDELLTKLGARQIPAEQESLCSARLLHRALGDAHAWRPSAGREKADGIGRHHACSAGVPRQRRAPAHLRPRFSIASPRTFFAPPSPSPVPVYARTFTQTHQAGLSVMNLQNGVLPHGWLEYMDESSGRPYYFNVHNQASAGLRRIAFARRPEGG